MPNKKRSRISPRLGTRRMALGAVVFLISVLSLACVGLIDPAPNSCGETDDYCYYCWNPRTLNDTIVDWDVLCSSVNYDNPDGWIGDCEGGFLAYVKTDRWTIQNVCGKGDEDG